MKYKYYAVYTISLRKCGTIGTVQQQAETSNGTISIDKEQLHKIIKKR